jgi:hypothetical protein
MSNTLLMIIEPAVRQADVAALERARHLDRMNTYRAPAPVIDMVPAKPEPSMSLMTYALVLASIHGTFLLSCWVLVMLVQQLIGVRPLW